VNRIVPSLMLLILALPGAGVETQPPSPHPLDVEIADQAAPDEDAPEKPQPLAKVLAETKIRRSPSAQAEALARLPGLPGLPIDQDVKHQAERFVALVSAGDWAGVGVVIAAQPAKQATELFSSLCDALGHGLISPEDVLALATIAPGGLDDERIQELGGLLREALRQSDAIESLLQRLDAGAGPLGGREAAARARAAALLLAAGRDADAGRFLPKLAEARAANDIRALELHARVLLARAGRDHDAAALDQAWACSQTVLASGGADLASLRTDAAKRIVAMLPRLPRELGDAWFDACFTAGGEPARLTLAALIGAVGDRLQGREPGERLAPLQLINRAAQSLLAVQDCKPWRPFLNALAVPWQVEAELVVGGGDAARRPWMNNDREAPDEIPADALAEIAPRDRWLAQVDPSLGLRLRRLAVEVIVRGADTTRGLALLGGLRGEQPEASDQLAEALLESWVRRQGGGGGNDHYREEVARYRKLLPTLNAQSRQSWQQYLRGIRQNQRNGNRGNNGGDPVTRTRQVRLLGELAGLLGSMRAAQLHLSAEVVINALVFQGEDISAVLGEQAALPVPLRLALASTMRERLSGLWRKPEVQQQAQTNRSDAETAAEVERGYTLALGLLGEAGKAEARLLRALLHYDYGEFRYGQKAPLAEYTALRDRAWADFAAAAELAGASDQPASAEVHFAWYRAALGASDLAQLTRQDEADPGQMRHLATALRSGGKAVAEERVRQFAGTVEGALDEVEGSLRPRFLRKAVELIGQHPAGETVRRRLAGYDEILAEVALQLRPEGEGAVGNEPFAATLALQHSTALGRESGGFGRYLNRQVQHRSGVQVNYLGDFEKAVREALEPRFRILALRFQAPTVQPRGCGRNGWRETPLAHLILSARDPAVDRLPPLRLDLDFPDGGGQVILPVSSPAVAIDARGTAVPRPWTAGEVVMTLDQRDPAQLTVEIEARGRGLPGVLSTLCEPQQPGLTLGKVEDLGLSLTGEEEAAGVLRPLSERRWRVAWTPGEARAFTFPALKDAQAKVVLRRWQDGEAVESPATITLSGPAPRWWPWAVGVGVLLAACLAVWRLLRRRHGPAQAVRWTMPAACTPFEVAALLARIYAEARLGDQERTGLAAEREALERACFTAQAAAPPDQATLRDLATRWLALANRQ